MGFFTVVAAIFRKDWKAILIIGALVLLAIFVRNWYADQIKAAFKSGADAQQLTWQKRYDEAIDNEKIAREKLKVVADALVLEQEKNQRVLIEKVDREIIQKETKIYADPKCKAVNDYKKDINMLILLGLDKEPSK